MASLKNIGFVIAGPTGVGKTDLAIRLAESLGGELISCDSVQVYRHLTIGANKTHTGRIPQHMLDLVEPSSTVPFTAADWLEGCSKVLGEIVSERHKVPILVGGTGFYLEWILRGRPSAPQTDPTVMRRVEEEILAGLHSCQEQLEVLRTVDPISAARLGTNDLYRLKRALTVFYQTGQPLSSFSRYSGRPANETIQWHCFYLTCPREVVSRRIDARCEVMVQAGLVEEVVKLVREGQLVPGTPAARSIGYQETLDFLDQLKQLGNPVEEEAADRLFLSYLDTFMGTTRGYARRQESWFRKAPEFHWIDRWDGCNGDSLDKVVEQIVSLSVTGENPFSHTRERILTDKASNSKNRRTYKSVLTIYGNREERKRFLLNLGGALKNVN